jgi:hypothetical protein
VHAQRLERNLEGRHSDEPGRRRGRQHARGPPPRPAGPQTTEARRCGRCRRRGCRSGLYGPCSSFRCHHCRRCRHRLQFFVNFSRNVGLRVDWRHVNRSRGSFEGAGLMVFCAHAFARKEHGCNVDHFKTFVLLPDAVAIESERSTYTYVHQAKSCVKSWHVIIAASTSLFSRPRRTLHQAHRKVKPTGVSLVFELLMMVPLFWATFLSDPVIDHKPVAPRYIILFREHCTVHAYRG